MEVSRGQQWLRVGAVAAAAALVWLCFAPGYMSVDSLVQLGEARSAISDLHPPLMSWIWRFMDRLVPGPAGMLAFHICVLWSGVWLHTRKMESPWRFGIAVLTVLTWPSVLAISGTLWKDVLFGASCLVATGALRLEPGKGSLALSFVFMVLAASARYNGISAILPIAAWWAYCAAVHFRRPTRYWPMAGVAITALVFLIAQLLSAALREAPSQNADQQIYIYDIAAIETLAPETGQLFPEAYVHTHPACTVDRVRAAYDRDNVCSLVFCPGAPCGPTTDRAEIDALRSSWRRAVVANLTPWVRHRAGLWRTLMGARSEHTYYPFHDGIDPNTLGVVFTRTTLNLRCMQALEAVKDTLFFRGWVYFLTALTLTGIGSLRRKAATVVLSTSGLLYALAYLPTAPVADFRLIWWLVVAVVVAAVTLEDADSS